MDISLLLSINEWFLTQLFVSSSFVHRNIMTP
jgi:hypothetical protein